MKKNYGKKILALIIACMMIVPTGITTKISAAVGELSNVSTGLSGDINTTDTISLPIQILDYESDGMLFEYAESNGTLKASDFGATWSADFTKITSIYNVNNSMFGNFWSDVSTAMHTNNQYASFLRATYKEKTAANNGCFYGRSSIISPNDLGGIAMDSARYLVIVYRSNITSGNIGFWVERTGLTDRTNNKNRVGDLTFTSEGTTNWTYAVYDLKQGNLKDTWSSYGKANCVFLTLPMDSANEYMDIAHIALFSDKAAATSFGEYALSDGSDRGDNRGFGLLRGSREEEGYVNKTYVGDKNGDGDMEDSNEYGNNYTGIIDADTTSSIKQLNTYSSSNPEIDFSTITTLGYTLLGKFRKNGIANVGLLESSLSEQGYPVYKQESVAYVAKLLQHSLEIPERTSDGWKNYRYVKGTVSDVYGGTDLATALRTRIKETLGSYADTLATVNAGKKLVGTWAECQANINSYYDAAYFLLNSIFVDGSYNIPQDDIKDSEGNVITDREDYNYLVLSKATDSESNTDTYVFDGGFTDSATPSSAKSSVKYDALKHTIQNSSAAGKTHFVYEKTSTTTLHPFLPITDRNNASGKTNTEYDQDDGVLNTSTTKDTYVNRNYNFALYSHGDFVYHADDELFFDFEGDDDVYLFINGELVMDIGSAHSIDGVRFELNDYVNAANEGTLGSDARNEKLKLVEGNTYSFAFYYMERHGYGSNMRIETNIRVTDSSMETSKFAYQDDEKLSYGSIVDKTEVIEYGFAIKNNGQENLFNLSFSDQLLGVDLSPSKGLSIYGSNVYDVNGNTLEAEDLIFTVIAEGYDPIEVTGMNNTELKAFLKNLTSDAVIENAGGLWIGSTLSVRGIGYKLTDKQITDGVFTNTVLTTATNYNESETLQGQASMRVFVPADPMYYQWAGHDLEISKTKLVEDILEAANSEENILHGAVANLTTSNVTNVQFVTVNDNPITYDYVRIDDSFNLTIHYPYAGSHVFYVRITYKTNSETKSVRVPVLVNVADVVESVFVLDYGLKVDLANGNDLFKNDAVTIPGRDTSVDLLGVASETPSYTPNSIHFTSLTNNTTKGEYGSFTLHKNALVYTPGDGKENKFMEGVDSIYLALSVHENDISASAIGQTDINNEVQMYKDVKVLPANVVYYEDDFPAIKYNTNNTFTNLGEGSGAISQSSDQKQNYGNDDAYDVNSSMSADSLTQIKINEYNAAAYFTFTGTGFELIARTNAVDYANLFVDVYKVSENDTELASGEMVKSIPVITQFDHNNDKGEEVIYQVPVIRVDDLTLGTYRVEIYGVPSRDYSEKVDGKYPIKDTYLYVDGVRIFNPIGSKNDAYLESENGATITELKGLIAGETPLVSVSEYSDTEGLTISSGTITWTEDLDGSSVSEDGSYTGQVGSVDDYLISGPNNEVYMDGNAITAALVFYVKENSDTNVHNLQIAVRGIDVGKFYGSSSTGVHAPIYYGVKNTDEYGWEKVAIVTSGTEQYYTIDYTKCPYTESKGYQVMIKVEADSGSKIPAFASYTSIKTNGLTLASNVYGEVRSVYYENGVLYGIEESGDVVEMAEEDFPVFYSVRRMMMAPNIVENTETDVPTEDEVILDKNESSSSDNKENTSTSISKENDKVASSEGSNKDNNSQSEEGKTNKENAEAIIKDNKEETMEEVIASTDLGNNNFLVGIISLLCVGLFALFGMKKKDSKQ